MGIFLIALSWLELTFIVALLAIVLLGNEPKLGLGLQPIDG
jgi:hypothetical protein